MKIAPVGQGGGGPLVDEEGQGDEVEIATFDGEHPTEPQQGEVALTQYGEHCQTPSDLSVIDLVPSPSCESGRENPQRAYSRVRACEPP